MIGISQRMPKLLFHTMSLQIILIKLSDVWAPPCHFPSSRFEVKGCGCPRVVYSVKNLNFHRPSSFSSQYHPLPYSTTTTTAIIPSAYVICMFRLALSVTFWYMALILNQLYQLFDRIYCFSLLCLIQYHVECVLYKGQYLPDRNQVGDYLFITYKGWNTKRLKTFDNVGRWVS